MNYHKGRFPYMKLFEFLSGLNQDYIRNKVIKQIPSQNKPHALPVITLIKCIKCNLPLDWILFQSISNKMLKIRNTCVVVFFTTT